MTIITTHSGQRVDIESPQPDSIRIEDIAHALSFLCRGSGQANFFFSVARHCVYCAREASARGFSREVVLACLLHDASEAYMTDVPKPIKDNLIPQYREYENALLDRIYRKFIGRALTKEELDQVALIDHVLLQYDLKYLLNIDTELPPIHIELKYEYIPFEQARQDYLDAFNGLYAQKN